MGDMMKRLQPAVWRVWWCGPLSGGGVAVGVVHIVAITLMLLGYLATVSFSQIISIIVILLCCSILYLVNILLIYASVHGKPRQMLPWLATHTAASLALLIYISIKFWSLSPYQSVYIATFLLSSYFCVVVFTHLQELRARPDAVKDDGDGEGTVRCDTILPESEDTVLDSEVGLGTSLSLPQPEEVISVDPPIRLLDTNPFLEDVFNVREQKTRESSVTLQGIRNDFTPFKKEEEEASGEDPPAKLRIFLPQTRDGEESDFDFSFNDPAFDSSLCGTRADQHRV